MHSDSKYYIFTPADVCTGGPEALHQLAYYMRICGLQAYTVYYDANGIVLKEPIERYKQYKPEVVTLEDIEDKSQNFCIAPENAPWCLNMVHRVHRCIWWLSLHANNVQSGTIGYRMAYWKRSILGQSIATARKILYNPSCCIHLCASRYTYDYVRHKYPHCRVEYMVEPISKDFLDVGMYTSLSGRQNVVLYNPAKPSDRMDALLQRAKFQYIPLKGLSPAELVDKYMHSKLYVDFGIFGGPERMPKEAVYFGCNILVANHAAAANDWDVAIPQDYKVDDGESIERTERRIEEMLNHYEMYFCDFNAFREKVGNLEDSFVSDIKRIFIN